jgi:hypothetical protein
VAVISSGLNYKSICYPPNKKKAGVYYPPKDLSFKEDVSPSARLTIVSVIEHKRAIFDADQVLKIKLTGGEPN